MAPREGTLVYDGREGCYVLHGCPLREGDPLAILAGTTWIAGHVGYEPSVLFSSIKTAVYYFPPSRPLSLQHIVIEQADDVREGKAEASQIPM